jgi:kumamolisin
MARVIIAGSERPAPRSGAIAGKRAGGAQLTVTVVVRRRNEPPTTEALIAGPVASLDAAEFSARFSADDADIAAVVRFARRSNLEVVDADARRAVVVLRGKADALAAAFRVDLVASARGAGKIYTHRNPVSVPASLADVVRWVFGLDTRAVLEHGPRAAIASRVDAPPAKAGATASTPPYLPPEVARLYDYPETPGALPGAGQCVGIIALGGGYRMTDINAYFDLLGSKPPAIVNVGANRPSPEFTMSDFEITTDLEVAASVCNGAQFVVYNSGSAGATVRSFYDMLSAAIHDDDNRPSVISTSWSFPEGLPDLGPTQGEVAEFEKLFALAAYKGITICASSGDRGSLYSIGFSDSDPGMVPGFDLPLTKYPASSPLVLGCGGTTLVGEAGTIVSEVVWNDLGKSMDVGPPFPSIGIIMGASGGGVARWTPLPSYQAQADVPQAIRYEWLNGALRELPPFRGRGVPDVAANAALITGYQMIMGGALLTTGGTSSAAPMWAALVARLNQGLQRRLGLLNPTLYALQIDARANVFRTTTSGNNGGFSASPDRLWNPCTGLGSPRGTALLAALRG